MSERPFSPYADRNAAPILEVLKIELSDCKKILEIGSGTGQHATHFATAMPGLQWQSSDLSDNHAAIRNWLSATGTTNVLAPIELDVLIAELSSDRYHAVYSANTSHIMSIECVDRMFELVARTLVANGIFCLYGPFQQGGGFNSPSNEAFHRSLRARDDTMGIRAIEYLDDLATINKLRRTRFYAMPANNNMAVWQKQAA